MAIFWEIAAHSVYHMFSFYYVHIFVILVVSHFGFEGGVVFFIAPVPGFPTRSDTNRAVQLQKTARSLKFWI